jgi:hypothetical protein
MTPHSSSPRPQHVVSTLTVLFVALAVGGGAVILDGQGPGGRQGGGGGGFGRQAGAPGGPEGPGGGRGQGRGQAGRGGDAQTAVGTGIISGVVITEGAGTPVRRARVMLAGTELRGGRSVITDDSGQFAFLSVPAGRFTMTASKSGYVDNAYGAKRAGRPGTPIQLADGQKLERTTITLPRGGVITGVVLDDHGEAAPGTQVRVLRYVSRTGEKTLQVAGSDSTDDRGMYRIFQLQPGEYVVNAIPRNQNAGDMRQVLTTELGNLASRLADSAAGANAGSNAAIDIAALAQARSGEIAARVSELQAQLTQAEQSAPAAYAPVYYPGTTSAGGALTVTLGISEERAGVDFQLQLVPTSRVSGTVTSSTSAIPQNTQIALIPADQAATPALRGLGVTMTRADATGRFSFSNITPGNYTIQARANIRDAATEVALAQAIGRRGGGAGGGGIGPGAGAIIQILWASANVTVSGQDVTGVPLNLQGGMTVSGRIEFKGAAAPPGELSRARVSLVPRGSDTFADLGSISSVQADDQGRFNITGVPPGTYSMTAQLNAGGGGRAAGAGPGRGGLTPATAPGGQWTLASAMINGRDVLDVPIEMGPGQDLGGAVLTFTDRSQELAGTIQDATGRPTADFTIIVFPAETRYWVPQARRIGSARPDTTGRFSFRSLPPGNYRMTAVTDVEPGEWYDPAFLAQLQQVSIPISLNEGEKKTQDIRLAAGQ